MISCPNVPQEIKDRIEGILVAKSSQKDAAEEMEHIVEEAACNALSKQICLSSSSSASVGPLAAAFMRRQGKMTAIGKGNGQVVGSSCAIRCLTKILRMIPPKTQKSKRTAISSNTSSIKHFTN